MKIMYWNANGVRHRAGELEHLMKTEKIEIALINETHLKPNINIYMANYKFYKTDRINRPGGGTAILVKKNIKHKQINPAKALTHLEATGIQILLENKPINIYAVYNPPNLELLETDFDAIMKNNETTIAAGDLNSKHKDWGSRTLNSNGAKLHRYTENRHIAVTAPPEPTRYSASGGEVLDIALAKNLTIPLTALVMNELSSDHLPVLLDIEGKTKQERDAIKTDWQIFKKSIKTPISIIKNSKELDEAILNFNNKITEAITTASTKIIGRETNKLPEEIVNLIKTKNRQRKIYNITLDPNDKTKLNQLNTDIQLKIHIHRNEQWTNKLEKMNEKDEDFNHKNLWKTAKALRKSKDKNNTPLVVNNKLTTNDKEKADIFSDSLHKQFSPNEDKIKNRTINYADKAKRIKDIPITTYIEPTTPEEVKKIIDNLNAHKAPGPDGICNKALKHLPKQSLCYITNLTNAIFRLRTFPNIWKHSHVIMLHKAGKPNKHPESYRPISLLPSLSKIIERLILKRLNEDIFKLNLIPNEQHGFRSNHATTHQLLRVTEKITTSLIKKEATVAVMLDVSKAFDRVWHEALIYKLHNMGINLPMVQLIKNYLSKRTFQVKVNGELSKSVQVRAGVPQGSVLGPVLYNLYTADVPRTNYTMLAVYADDTAILAKSYKIEAAMKKIQTHLNKIDKWTKKWKIDINPNKTQAIVFTEKKFKYNPTNKLTIANQDISWTNQVKYLGVTLDKKLTFKKHIEETRAKANKITGYLYPLLCNKSKLNEQNKILLYKQIIRPTMTYASVIWHNANSKITQQLTRKQNIILRQILQAPWYITNAQIHRETAMITLTEHIENISTKFYDKVKQHSNEEIRKATQNNIGSQKRKRPSDM